MLRPRKLALWNRITLLMTCFGCRQYKLSKYLEKHKKITVMRDYCSDTEHDFILLKFCLLFTCSV
jgi:hypothetical protein